MDHTQPTDSTALHLAVYTILPLIQLNQDPLLSTMPASLAATASLRHFHGRLYSSEQNAAFTASSYHEHLPASSLRGWHW